MENAIVPILGFAAFSGTGKTTLLEKLIPLLSSSGLRVGLIKHSHHSFDIDKPGKDSYKLRQAGASPVMLVSMHRRAMITEFRSTKEPCLNDQLKAFDQTEIDLILVEGFKSEFFPKIELYRPSLKNKLLFPNDPSIIAIATDEEIEGAYTSALSDEIKTPTLLDINNPALIVQFIVAFHEQQKENLNNKNIV